MAVAAAAIPGSDVSITNVGLNPSRAALLDVLRRFGAEVEATIDDDWNGEPVGRLRSSPPHDDAISVIAPDEVPEVIDELPVLATLGTFGGSVTVSGAGELRVKESDRIAELVAGLRAMGADADERPDGFQVRCGRRLTGGTVHARHDHRLAMAFAIAALGATGPTHDRGRGCGRRLVSRVLRGSRSTRRAAGERNARVKADKIYLVGFMGAGKSSVARALGKRLDWKVEDIDARIERAERRDIPTHLSRRGRTVLPRPRTRSADRPAAGTRRRRRVGRRHLRRCVQSRADAEGRRRGLAGRAVRNRAAARARSTAAARWLPIGWVWNSFIISASRPTARRTSGWTQDAAPSRSWSITSWSGWTPDT